jgi:hypothetical protein
MRPDLPAGCDHFDDLRRQERRPINRLRCACRSPIGAIVAVAGLVLSLSVNANAAGSAKDEKAIRNVENKIFFARRPICGFFCGWYPGAVSASSLKICCRRILGTR